VHHWSGIDVYPLTLRSYELFSEPLLSRLFKPLYIYEGFDIKQKQAHVLCLLQHQALRLRILRLLVCNLFAVHLVEISEHSVYSTAGLHSLVQFACIVAESFLARLLHTP
jgi:hypothetical protein